MNPVIKAQVGDFSTTNALEERSESELFEIYSIYAILNGGLGESIDPLEAHLEGTEFGMDGVAILVQGRLVYYAACYLNYKLDFLWRNQRIDNSLKIYRYYLLAAIGRKSISGRDVFSLKRSDLEASLKALTDLAEDEPKLKKAIALVSRVLDRQVNALGLSARERLRDAIRSETFAKSFETELAKVTFPS